MQSIIQQTDSDALSAKLASITKKYLPPGPDSCTAKGNNSNLEELYKNYGTMHIEYLNTLKSSGNNRRMYGKLIRNINNSAPVMNYGTYLRTLSIDLTISKFLNQLTDKSNCQIVNLGCGSDLRCLQFINNINNKYNITRYIDVDFKETVTLKKKILTLMSNKTPSYSLDPNIYQLMDCDLNDLTHTMTALQDVTDINVPTIFITECTLCYMPQLESQRLINSIRETYRSGLWISYDPIGGSDPNDRFGKIMRENLLMSRNLDMPTLLTFNSKDSYSDRWNLYNTIHINDMWEFLHQNISSVEQKRLQSVQFLDEIEELKIMQSHYVILSSEW